MRWLSLVLVLLVAGCSLSGGGGERPPQCGTLGLDDFAGTQPEYLDDQAVAVFPGVRALCQAMWLPHADDDFVPQGLALDGDEAWVSGYRDDVVGHRACQLAHVRLTGEELAFVDQIVGSVAGRDPVLCRHGGGLELTSEGLWLAETDRLWLLDPRRVGKSDPVVRGWRLEPPVRGSFLVRGRGGLLGVAGYRSGGRGHVFWYDRGDLLGERGAVLVASHRSASPGFERGQRVTPRRVGRTPRRAQGGTPLDGGRPTYTASTSGCGKLRPPGGRLAFVPGAEDIERRGPLLWAVSEAGAGPYQELGRPLVPMLGAYRLARVLRGHPPTCRW